MEKKLRVGLIRVLTTQDLDLANSCILSFHTEQVTITSAEPLPWTLDGEFGGQHEEVHIINKKQALEIMIEREDEE